GGVVAPVGRVAEAAAGQGGGGGEAGGSEREAASQVHGRHPSVRVRCFRRRPPPSAGGTRRPGPWSTDTARSCPRPRRWRRSRGRSTGPSARAAEVPPGAAPAGGAGGVGPP